MTEPRVLVFGYSCIRRLRHFLSRVPNVLALVLSYLTVPLSNGTESVAVRVPQRLNST